MMKLLLAAIASAVAVGVAVPVGSPELLLLGSCALIVIGAVALMRPSGSRDYPHSPRVTLAAGVTVAVVVVAMLATVYLDESYRRQPSPDSLILKILLAVFGRRRYLVTWPIIILLTVGIGRAARSLHRRWRASRSPRS